MDPAAEHKALKEMIGYAAGHSPFYRRMFGQHGIHAAGITTISDLRQIPFTRKQELQDHNRDFICVPRNRLVDYVTTSGTTGKPVTLALTDKDLDRLALNEFTSFRTAGLTEDDTIQLMTTMDRRFMAGLAYFLGARKLGAGIIRVGNGSPELQWDTIADMQPTAIIAVPSFIVKLIEFAEGHGIDYRRSPVKKAICIGESIRHNDFSLNALGLKIAEKWDLELYSTYASSEMATAFTECNHFHGGHLQSDLLIAELVDENGAPVKEGEAGELVITTLGVEAMPLIRFKTGDICVAHTDPCPCGRTGMRLGPVLGRKQQRIKYKGTSFYPQALYEILENIKNVRNYQVEVAQGALGTDEITVHIGLNKTGPDQDREVAETFRAKLRVVPRLNFLSPSEVNGLLQSETSRKPLKFVDKRQRPI